MAETKFTTPESVALHAAAIDEIRRALSQFPAYERIVVIAGVLGEAVCEVPAIKEGKAGKVGATLLIDYAASWARDRMHLELDGDFS